MNAGLSIECPHCHAGVGLVCLDPNGKWVRTHVARIKAEPTRQPSDPVVDSSAPYTRGDLLNTIIHGDALTEMQRMPDGCVDLAFTSPPYNLRQSTGGQGGTRPRDKWRSELLRNGYRHHHDKMSVPDYIEWQRAVVREMARLVAPGGAIFYNHRRRVQADVEENHALEIIDAAAEFGLLHRQTITWHKGSGYNHNPGYYLPSTEQIYLLARRGEFRYRALGRTDEVWSIGRVPKPATKELSLTAPFPVALVRKALDPIGDLAGSRGYSGVVLDPFMGSGTTAVAAVEAGWRYVGIEIDAELVQYARERVANTEPPVRQRSRAGFALSVAAPKEEPDAEEVEAGDDQGGQAGCLPNGETVPTLRRDCDREETPGPDVSTVEAAGQIDHQIDQVGQTDHLEGRKRIIYDHISDSIAAMQGQWCPLSYEDIGAATEIPPTTVKRHVAALERGGFVLKRRQPGRPLYGLPGVSPLMPSDEVSQISQRTGNGLSGGLSENGLSAGRPANDLNGLSGGLSDSDRPFESENVEEPAGRQIDHSVDRPPDRPSTDSWDAPAPSCPACGPTPVTQSRIASDRGVPGVTWYCAGRGQSCGFLWHYDAGGMVREPDEPRHDDYSMMAEYLVRCIYRHRKGLPGLPTSGNRDEERRYSFLDSYRERHGALPREREVYSVTDRPSPAPPLEPRPEPPPWDETNPDYCADRPDPVSTWQAALGRLQLEIPQEQFNTFLRPCSGLRWEDDCLVVGAATTFAVSWLELPLHLEMVREAVAKTVGVGLSVRYKAVPASHRDSTHARRNHEQSE